MKKVFTLLILVFLMSISGFAQTATDIYLQQENTRIANANATEQLIASFIANNLSSYSLSYARLSQVTSPVIEGVTQTLTGQALQDATLEAEKVELRKLYFQQNPSSLLYYIAATIPATVECLNGGFEGSVGTTGGSTAGYSFVSETYTDQYIAFTKIPTNVPQVSPTGIITLVDNSINDPKTNLSRVHSGTHAIRLNNADGTRFTNAGNRWGTVSGLSKTFTVSQNTVSFNFALVFEYVETHREIVADPKANPPILYQPSYEPYFQCFLRSATGAVLYERQIVSNPANTAVFHDTNPSVADKLLYSDWVCENIDTSQFMGQDVTLQIFVSDCGKSGHFGYAYLDDFCGVPCTAPAFGSLKINPLNVNCPSFPMTVSGTFTPPTNNTINASLTTLNIINSSKVIVGTVSNPVITGNTYTFTLNQTDFFGVNTPTTGDFEVKVNATFILNGSTYQTVLHQQSANAGVDVSFNNCMCCSSCCPDNLSITTSVPLNFSDRGQASSTIIATNVINGSPGNLTTAVYHAGTSVMLKPGFNAKAYCNFHAYIQGCSGTFQNRLSTNTEIGTITNVNLNSKNTENEIALVKVSNSKGVITVHPNPSNGVFKISINDITNGIIEVTDLYGRKVYKSDFKNQSEFDMNLQDNSKGVYIVKVVSGDQTYIEKIIKN